MFYELLVGLDPAEREQLSLQEPETYYYLNQVRSTQCGQQGLPGEGSPCRGLKRSWSRARSWVARPCSHPCYALQGRACRLQGKEDAQDFTGLVKALKALDLCPEELTAVWAVLATILQLGNICFSSSEVGSPEALGPCGLFA